MKNYYLDGFNSSAREKKIVKLTVVVKNYVKVTTRMDLTVWPEKKS